jgi:flagellar assembly factor FliW
MKFSTDSVLQDSPELKNSQMLKFSDGIVGFPEFTSAEIVYKPEELPFMWLKGTGAEKLSFLMVEPAGIIPGYEIEVSESDVLVLGLTSAQEAAVFVIATLQGNPATSVTLNLIGPILVNRRTLEARQVVVLNSHRYSARHPLIQTTEG